jgi:multiple sugar transport system substrate-binding protein
MASNRSVSRRGYLGWSAAALGTGATACGALPGGGSEQTSSSRPIVEVVMTVPPGEAVARADRALAAFNALAETTRVRATTVQAPPGDDHPALAARIIAGADEDVYFSQSVGLPHKFQGLYKPLDPLARNDKEVKPGNYVTGTWNACGFKDKLYGLPYHFSGALMFYSKTLLRNYNQAQPKDTWTWADFADLAKKLTRSGDKPTWGTWALVHWPTVDVWLHRGGGGNWDNKGNSILDKPETLTSLQFLQDLYTKQGVVAVDDKGLFLNLGNPSPSHPFVVGQVGLWYIGPHVRSGLADPKINTAPVEWDQVEMPVRQAGMKADLPSGTGMNAMWNTSKRPEAAWQLVRWLSLPQAQMVRLSEGGWPALKQALNDPAFVNWEGKNNKFITERVVAPGTRDFPGASQFEQWLLGNTADDPNATKLLDDFAYGRVSAREFVDRAHPVAKRLREKYENAK